MERLTERDSHGEDRRSCEQAHEEADRDPPTLARPALPALDHAW